MRVFFVTMNRHESKLLYYQVLVRYFTCPSQFKTTFIASCVLIIDYNITVASITNVSTN